MENKNVLKVSVALSPLEIKIVKKKEKKLGLNFSSALRIIIREWEEHEAKANSDKAHIVGQSQPAPIITGELSGVMAGSVVKSTEEVKS